MIYTFPDYYALFSCTADQCEDTCCAGWQIVIDPHSFNQYKNNHSPYSKTLRQSIDWQKHCFKQDINKRCAFLDSHNLCRMYTNLGPQSLCKTCRLYPRHIEEFENVREISLSISCPEAARIILSQKDPVTFRTIEKNEEETWEDFDFFLFSVLMDARDAMLMIFQNRFLSFESRMILAHGLSHDLQRRINHNQLFTCNEQIEKYKQHMFDKQASNMTFYDYDHLKIEFLNLYQLELLNENWENVLNETYALLFSKGQKNFTSIFENFTDYVKEHAEFEWDIICEQLAVYFIFTYFCGSVYDEKVYKGTKMILSCISMIEMILISRWIKNGRTLFFEDIVEICYRFSRELEHSDQNLKLYLEFM